MVAANILGRDPREATTAPCRAWSSPTRRPRRSARPTGRSRRTVQLADVPRTSTYTREYERARLPHARLRWRGAHRRLRAGPGGGRVAPAGDARHPRARPARRPARHDPALPDVLGGVPVRAAGAHADWAASRLADRLGQHEADVLLDDLELLRRRSTPRSRKKPTSRCTSSSGALAPGRDADDALALEPLLADLAPRCRSGATSAPCSRATSTRRLRVRRVLRADDEHEVAVRGHLLDGRLAVRRGVADVVGARTGDAREALAQPGDDRARLVDRQRRLRDVGDAARDRRPRARRRPPRSRRGRCARAPRPSCPRPPRGRRGR